MEKIRQPIIGHKAIIKRIGILTIKGKFSKQTLLKSRWYYNVQEANIDLDHYLIGEKLRARISNIKKPEKVKHIERRCPNKKY